MKIKKGIDAGMFLGLLAMVILTIAMFPTEGRATTADTICSNPSASDYDSDGIPDNYECIGFTLADGSTHVCGYEEWNTGWPVSGRYGCNSSSTYKVDPSTMDLFVILDNTYGGLLCGTQVCPNSLFQNISNLVVQNSGGGLGITTHPVTVQQVPTNADLSIDRQLTLSKDQYGNYLFTQKATYTYENFADTTIGTINCRSLGSSAVTLGSTTTGVTPNTQGINSKVYTNRLSTWINNMCGGVCTKITSCYDNATGVGIGSNAACTRSGTPYACCTGKGTGTCTGVLPDLINYYQKQNIDHEIGHMMCLASDNTTTTHHYTSSQNYSGYTVAGTGAGSIMEDHAFYTSSSNSIVFYIPQVFDASDPNLMRISGTTCPTQ